MYKPNINMQHSILDFEQPIGMHLNPDNRWIKMANSIPWDKFEGEYAAEFPSQTGNVAKPFRLAMGALIIQTKFQYSDRELVEQITENPYLQYFIGLPGYQEAAPFDATTLVLFRKRITIDMINEINEYLLSHKDDAKNPPSSGSSSRKKKNRKSRTTATKTTGSNESSQESVGNSNQGTLMLDATCAPVNISYPQDISLLNKAREYLEKIIYRICNEYHLIKPRCYKRKARKDYLSFAKQRKHTGQKIRQALKKQLSYVKRDLKYLGNFISSGIIELTSKEIDLLQTIIKLYEQQKYMYDNKTHSVENRIVSITQPWIRPIVRGKAQAPVEFGPKLEVSLDEEGFGRLEKVSFEAYNEGNSLQDVVESFRERTEHYPERVLADQIYRNRNNRNYCKQHNIRLSGPKLGRPSTTLTKPEKKQAYQDNTDRIAVERYICVNKRCYSMNKNVTKLQETKLTSIALSVFVTNLFKLQRIIIFVLIYLRLLCRNISINYSCLS